MISTQAKLAIAAAALAAVALAGGVGYLKGRSDGASLNQAAHDADLAKATEKTLAAERDLAALKSEVDNVLKPGLVAAESSVTGLSRRLRLASARSCPLPADAGAASGPADGGGIPSGVEEIERDADSAWRGAARDSVKFVGCRDFYNEVRRKVNDIM